MSRSHNLGLAAWCAVVGAVAWHLVDGAYAYAIVGATALCGLAGYELGRRGAP